MMSGIRFAASTAAVLLCSGPLSVAAHSWATDIAGGLERGFTYTESDQVKQRYFCPLKDLAACQPPAKHHVVLTAENQQPCRSGDSPKWGSAVAGQDFTLQWAGNGHANNQSAGTCVTVKIAKFSEDPSYSDFSTTLAACLPYYTMQDGVPYTGAEVMLPADLPAGKYTLFWLWNFSPFWFSSCGDIDVWPAGSVHPTDSVGAEVAKGAAHDNDDDDSTTVAPVAATAANSTFPEAPEYHARGCAGLPNPKAFCTQHFGADSYCRDFQRDTCGRSVCEHSDISQLKSCEKPAGTPAPGSANRYASEGCSASDGDAVCRAIFGELSYCRYWVKDTCRRSQCFGGESKPLTTC